MTGEVNPLTAIEEGCRDAVATTPLPARREHGNIQLQQSYIVGYVYFTLCEQLGLSILWSFLMGVLPAWPFALAAARTPRSCVRAVWLWAAFTVFYWSAAAFLGWKALRAEEWTA